jgi:hypothetical protein
LCFEYEEDGVLDKDRRMDNVHKHNICTNVPLSQTLDMNISSSAPASQLRLVHVVILPMAVKDEDL